MAAYGAYTDEQLLQLLQTGDEPAFTELYNRYWEKMTIVAYAKLGSAEDAREVVQDVFTELWRRRRTLAVRHSFHTYLSASVSYRIFTLLAKQRDDRQKHSQLVVAQADDSTRQWLSFSDLREELEKVLLTLPDKCRLVFRLSREAGLTRDEIARQLDISPKTVEAHLTRALRTLKKIFGSFFMMFH